MHSWTWKEVGARAYLTCSLLEAWPHGFFTQAWWPSAPDEITPTLAPDAIAYRVKQVHGNVVLTPTDVRSHQTEYEQASPLPDTSRTDESEEQFPFPNADGLMSEAQSQALWVASADCTPALIADVATGAVAAAHAGWRGTAQQIIPTAIRQMQEQGSQLEHIRVALGPAIAGEVYQVSTTVAAQVGQTVLSNVTPQETLTTDDVALIVEKVSALPDSPILEDAQDGRARLDVRRVNQLQLENLGLSEEQVAIAPYCTFQCPDHFFSYRRSRLKKVQWSGIVSR